MPCTWSLETTRKKVGYLPVVSVAFVADPEMNAIPALANSGPTASTSWLPAGPTTPTIELFEVNCCVTVVAWAGLSCVSPWTIVILVLFAALSMDTASSAKCSCSWPSTATGPVSGPSMPIDVAHVAAAAFVPDPELPHPASASAPSAAVAAMIPCAFNENPSRSCWSVIGNSAAGRGGASVGRNRQSQDAACRRSPGAADIHYALLESDL